MRLWFGYGRRFRRWPRLGKRLIAVLGSKSMYRFGYCWISLDIRYPYFESITRGHLLIINRAGNFSATVSASDGLIVATPRRVGPMDPLTIVKAISTVWGRIEIAIPKMQAPQMTCGFDRSLHAVHTLKSPARCTILDREFTGNGDGIDVDAGQSRP